MEPSWVQEGSSIPVKQSQIGSSTLTRHKLSCITTCSNELLKRSNPAILDLMESFIKADLSEALDGFLLDPSNAAVPAVRPGAITASAANQASAGNTLSQILTDWRWLISQSTALRMVQPVVLMHSDRVIGLQMAEGTADTFPLRKEVAAGSLFGLPILHSPYVPNDLCILMDASSLQVAADQIEVDTSRTATIVMASDDGVAPSMLPPGAVDSDGSLHVSDAAGTTPSTEVKSMFQMDATALRLVSPMSWIMTAPRVAYLSSVDW